MVPSNKASRREGGQVAWYGVGAHGQWKRPFEFPTKQKRRSTSQGAKEPPDHQRPEKNGSRMAPSVTSFRAPNECHDFRRAGRCEPRLYLFHPAG